MRNKLHLKFGSHDVLKKLNIYGVQSHITMLIQGLPGKYVCCNTKDSAGGPEECVYFMNLLGGSHPGEVTVHAR